MPKKGGFWDDTFEQVGELARSTVKETGRAVKSVIIPEGIIEQATGADNSPNKSKEKQNKKDKHTPLDFDKLQNSYQKQDNQKTDDLRNKLFQLVKSGDEKVLQDKDQKEKNREQQVLREEQEKKRRQEEAKRRTQNDTAPQGKERKSILGKKKKKAKPEITVENKANASKQ